MITVNEIAAEMFKAKTQPMDDRQSRLFFMLLIIEHNKMELPPEIAETFQFQVMKKRLESHYVIPVANAYAMAVLALMAENVGSVVMYAGALAAMYAERKEVITIKTIAEHYFPMGFPTEEELDRIWDMQKIPLQPTSTVSTDNAIDLPDSWPKIEAVEA